MSPPWLTDAELRDATHRKLSRAHAAALDRIGMPFKNIRKGNGFNETWE